MLGNVFGALLSDPETKAKFYSNNVAGRDTQWLDALDANRAANLTSGLEYDLGLKTAADKVRGLEAGDMSAITNLLNKGGNRDYLADYQTGLGMGLDAFDRVADRNSGYNSRYDKQLAANLGYGGRPTNSYLAKVYSDRESKNNVPLLQTIFGGAPGLANNAQNAYLQNLQTQLGLMDARAGIPYRGTMNPVLAADFRNNAFESDIGNFANLANIQKSNVAGFETKDNKWANAFNAAGDTEGQLLNAFTTLASAYLGGGGGANPVAAPQPTAPTFQPNAAIAQAPAFYGGQSVSPYPQQVSPYPTGAPLAQNWATQPPPWWTQSQGGFGWTGY